MSSLSSSINIAAVPNVIRSWYNSNISCWKFDLLNAVYIASVDDSNQSFASSSLSISSSLNFKVNQGVAGFVSIPCNDAANNSTACIGDESKTCSILLSPLALCFVTSAFLGCI